MKMILLVVVWSLYMITAVECKMRIVDLSHSLNNSPTNKGFEIKLVANITDDNYYTFNDISFSEHTGTHLDAPTHFSDKPGLWFASAIPVERLVGSVSLIDLEEKAQSDRDYVATVDDITSWEEDYGKIPKGAIVLFNYGWSKYWESYSDVFGSNSTDPSTFHFPGISLEGAKLLANREVYGVGLDTPSVDPGNTVDYSVHRYLAQKNIYFLENVGDTSALPPGGVGVTLVVGAMKIDAGTGGPARLIAMFDDESDKTSSSTTLFVHSFITVISVFLALCL